MTVNHQTLVKRFTASALLGIASIFAFGSHARAASPSSTASAAAALASARTDVLASINATRAAHGLSALTIDRKQSACSLQHSQSMAAAGSLFHNNLATDDCSKHTLLAQNVGEASGTPSQAAIQVQNMMIDEGPCPTKGCPGDQFEQHGHFVNMLNPSAHHVGIGLTLVNGAVWLTEDFTS